MVSRRRARGGSRPLSLPAPCSTKGWRARAPNSPHTHSSMPHCYASPATNQLPMPEPRTPRDPPESTDSTPLRVPPFALGSRSPPHTDPCPLSLVHSHMLHIDRSHVRWRTLCSSTYAPVCHAALAPKPSPLPHPLIAATLTPATVNRLLSRLFSRWREGKGRLAPPFAPRTT